MTPKVLFRVLFFLAFPFFQSCVLNDCKWLNVKAPELTGLYTMHSGPVLDTLLIKRDFTFYHSARNKDTKDFYHRTGKWKSTVDGYYEFSNYAPASEVNSWYTKPYKCSMDGMITIPKCNNEDCVYKKVKSL